MERWDDDALDSIIAFEPQSTAGDYVASLIYLCEDDPDWPPTARMLMNIHDALLTINKIEDGEAVRAIMKKHNATPLVIRGEELIIPADFKVTKPGKDGIHRWSTLSKVAV